ncbi:hypothetical protein Galf_2400 [Gallionella capsiferriformans ES-2]|uniref:Uncharacterized protein n=2 Tax=Gallionella TaxID=96 RepID=D9SJY9_GALCS|nr:hypothetical protein Galf_2400 [Gallionella capsiferriformans ES-2]
MIIRTRAKCTTCDSIYTLRIRVGNNPSQRHSIRCICCNEDMIAGLEIDFNNVKAKPVFIENCEETAEEGKVINLDPDHPVPDDMLHMDMIFPWMQHVEKSFYLNKRHPNFPEKASAGPIFVDIYQVLGSHHNIVPLWNSLKKAWSLSNSGKSDLSVKALIQYSTALGLKEPPSLNEAIYDFLVRLIMPAGEELIKNAAQLWKSLESSNPAQTRKFVTFYRSDLHKDNFARAFEVFSEYFKVYSDFSQTELYAKNDTKLPEKSTATSVSFKETKQFYGNAFEALTSNFTTLACINNLFAGRKYDEFKEMTLKMYLTINKANRQSPFESQKEFSAFSACIDSTLRNSSHHAAIKLENQKVVYRSGGTGAIHKINYSEYLLKCNQIMFSLAALTCLELVIAF